MAAAGEVTAQRYMGGASMGARFDFGTVAMNSQSAIPVVEDASHELLSHLWRGGNWAYWWTPDGPWYYSKKHRETRQAKEALWFPLHLRWPAIPAVWRARNVYFGVHPTTAAGERWQRARIATVATINAIFAEFDIGKGYETKRAIWDHLDTLPLYPTCVIDSGGGLHCYWFIERPQPVTDDNRAYLKRCQAAWVDLVGSDNGAKDLARVLRLPGFLNRKPRYAPDYPQVQIAEFDPRRQFPFQRITEFVDTRIAAGEEAERRRREEDAVRMSDVGSGAADRLLDWAVSHVSTGSRHNMALWLAGRLKAEGFAQWTASSVLREYAHRVNASGSRQLDDSEMDSIVRYIWGIASS